MKNKTLIIIVVVVIVLLIGFGIYAYVQSNKAPSTAPPIANNNTSSGDIFTGIADLFSRLFKKKEPLPPFVQTPPIDEDGCDANGFNRIGIRCL